ncbi:HET-domain-containing protein, partial [Lophiostoma macrostomum CBS 122681]
WLQECSRTHSACGAATEHELPTRVIDVGRDGEQEPRLVETSGRRGQWVALSYCWGGAPPLTTAETYERNLEALPFSSLPKLFQDSVTVVRSLGFQYLWIDTLCIIQGDKKDWERECSRMRTVYEHSAITLSAPAASSPDFTMLHNRSSVPQVWFRFQDSTLSAGISHILPDTNAGMPKQQSSPLSTRGWILQERLLAPRSLYFGENLMYWECRSADRFENLSSEQPIESPLGPVPKSVFKGLLDSSEPKSQGREMWRRLVETYCTCDLTNPLDRLPALSGLAQKMNIELQDLYMAGLWLGGLKKDLAWFRDPHTTKTAPEANVSYKAPSWSWASQVLPVKFHNNP